MFITSLLTFTALALFMINQYDTFRLKKCTWQIHCDSYSFLISLFYFLYSFLSSYMKHPPLTMETCHLHWVRQRALLPCCCVPLKAVVPQSGAIDFSAACFKEVSLLLVTIHISVILSMLVGHHIWCAIYFPLMSGMILGIIWLPSDYLQLLFSYLLNHQNCWHYSTWDVTLLFHYL